MKKPLYYAAWALLIAVFGLIFSVLVDMVAGVL